MQIYRHIYRDRRITNSEEWIDLVALLVVTIFELGVGFVREEKGARILELRTALVCSA